MFSGYLRQDREAKPHLRWFPSLSVSQFFLTRHIPAESQRKKEKEERNPTVHLIRKMGTSC
jgi:hypothetical protein